MRYTAGLTVRFTEEMLEELQRLAERERRSVASMIRIAVEKMLEKEREQDCC